MISPLLSVNGSPTTFKNEFCLSGRNILVKSQAAANGK